MAFGGGSGGGKYPAERIAGVIEARNAEALCINGKWWNFGGYFKGDPDSYAKGQYVEGTGAGKYLKTLEVVGASREMELAAKVVAAGGVDLRAGAVNAFGASGSHAGRSAETDKRIARQVALKAAVEMSVPGAKGPVDAEIVLSKAARLEVWLNRPFTTETEGGMESTEEEAF